MSSLIPKINIGVDTHNSHFDLSSMTHATSEIGYVMPTFSKYLVPKSRVSIGTRTGSRLSPLFVPTMGQLEIRHYHCFIPFNTIWFPFDAFLTKTNYTLPTSTTYIPRKCPSFTVKSVISCLFHYNTADSVALRDCLSCAVYQDNVQLDSEAIQNLGTSLLALFQYSGLHFMPQYLISSDGVQFMIVSTSDFYEVIRLSDNAKVSHISFPSLEHCDFTDIMVDAETTFTFAYNFNGAVKRLRSIFMGLGYSFNPYDTEKVTPFKLLAFYKAYWSLFGVNRSYNFFNTYCYKLIKALSETTVTDMNVIGSVVFELFENFIVNELANCTYTCPADYFSASDLDTQRSATESNGYSFGSPVTNIDGTAATGVVGAFSMSNGQIANDVRTFQAYSTTQNSGADSPLGQKIALRLLRFVNKNSVIGRQVSEILRSRYGVSDIHNALHEQVERIGASKTPINISAIYNNTDSGTMPLGSYAGLGVSGQQGAISKKFTFETKEFGVVITLSSVVPKMGYFQGMFRENSDGVIDNTEFYTPEFDAIAWQSVRYNELIADRQFMSEFHSDAHTPDASTDLGIFGYNPTYQHYKVSFNRVLGDISLPSLQDSMLPYTLDRFFKNKQLDNYPVTQLVPPDLPPNDPMYFRAGTRGETNRIFSDMSPTEDHVIMQIFFDVKMRAPMKSIANSYDTIDEETTHTTEVGHE